MIKTETIIALATPPGRGSIGIIRISGNLVITIAKKILKKIPYPRKAEYLSFYKNNNIIIDKGIVIFFKNPNSFTGEDIIEFHCHGGPIVLDLLMTKILSISGVRIAYPGEFSERAFINNKIDLAQAEAISDLIQTNSVKVAISAVKSLQGNFSKKINKLLKELTNLRVLFEAYINFPDEEIDNISNIELINKLNNLILILKKIKYEAIQSNIVHKGINIVITGLPNTGKSTLINILTQKETSIVTNIAGTTRDIIRETINFNGISLSIIDTAGIRKPIDKIEKIGIDKAWNEIKNADHLLFIIDDNKNFDKIILKYKKKIKKKIPITIVRNKTDLSFESFGLNKKNGYKIINISAKYNKGINILKNHLKNYIGLKEHTEINFLARKRHIHALKIAYFHLKKAKNIFKNSLSFEIVGEELKLAQDHINQITGKFTSNDLLKKIFSKFCIGK